MEIKGTIAVPLLRGFAPYWNIHITSPHVSTLLVLLLAYSYSVDVDLTILPDVVMEDATNGTELTSNYVTELTSNNVTEPTSSTQGNRHDEVLLLQLEK